MSVVLEDPPYTPVEPVTDVWHGLAITDPYRWLEDSHSDRTRRWIASQTQYARTFFNSIPGRARIRKRVAELLSVDSKETPCKVGERCFFLRRTAQQDQAVICVRDGEDGDDEVLVAPEDAQTAVRIVSVSRDGNLLAYALKLGGEDSSQIRIFDVSERRTLPDGLTRGFLSGFAFAPDSKSYYYVHEPSEAARPCVLRARRHFVGDSSHEDDETFAIGPEANVKLGMRMSDDGRYLVYIVVRSQPRKTIDLYLHDAFSDAPARLIAENMEEPFFPFIVERQLIVMTRSGAPNKRVVSIDVDSPARENWRELVPETNSAIRDIAVRQRRIFVTYVENLAARTDIYDLSGRKLGILPYPPNGTVRLLSNPVDDGDLFYTFSSFVQPETVFRYRIETGEQLVWSQRDAAFDDSSVDVRQVWYASKDGTRVPMFLVGKRGYRLTGNIPTVLTGYGGFGKTVTPQFSAFATFVVEHGGLFAVANIRGGSELGEQWHEDGKRRKRQNAFDDFIAAAEWLVQAGYTRPTKLAIAGASNGGLLVGAALTQRPDLFCAAICVGPLLDMLRYHNARFADGWIDEYGSADNAGDFPYLYAYSPYQHVRNGVLYPSVLLVSGDADTRCDPMHARKMTARLQAAGVPGRKILLDYSPLRGHVPALPLSERIDALTDRLAFLCEQLGLRV
ncbi:MAG TPA: prolyl oligopeptidase family serine peptidase [Pyrinomonadaceae bacterium]|nr:prolyl oligopeptidase family serine peptidase [Pyrinomonadaceae bacterium]